MATVNVFNSEDEKKNFDRYEFSFTTRLGILDAWQISQVTEELICLYYKAALIEAIAKFANNDFELSDLIISDKTADHEKIPKKDYFQFKDRVDLIYNSRLCLPLAYNPLQSDIARFFDAFDNINEALFRINKKGKISLGKLIKYIDLLRNNNIIRSVQELKKDALKKVYDEDARKILNIRFDSIFSGLRKSLEKDIILQEINEISIENFFENFNDQKIPVVAILDSETDYRIACHRHLIARETKDRFDVRSIMHNSPTLIQIVVAPDYFAPCFLAFSTAFKAFLDIWNSRQDAIKKGLDNKKQEEEEATMYLKQEQAKIIAEALESCSLAYSKYSKDIFRAINSIKNGNLKSNLNKAWDILVNKYAQFIENYQIYPLKAQKTEV